MNSHIGIVQEGVRRGKTLGFPTANITLDDTSVSGIYVASVAWNGREHPAAVFADQKRGILEAHMLDFSGNLYGKEIVVQLLEKIRDNKMFENDDYLRTAIAGDVEKVREFFKNV
ncbi:MAG: riboflavin kinase [Patescibacteria group bacterium]